MVSSQSCRLQLSIHYTLKSQQAGHLRGSWHTWKSTTTPHPYEDQPLSHKAPRWCEPLVWLSWQRESFGRPRTKAEAVQPLYVTLKCWGLLHTEPARDSPLPSNTTHLSAHMHPPLVSSARCRDVTPHPNYNASCPTPHTHYPWLSNETNACQASTQ